MADKLGVSIMDPPIHHTLPHRKHDVDNTSCHMMLHLQRTWPLAYIDDPRNLFLFYRDGRAFIYRGGCSVQTELQQVIGCSVTRIGSTAQQALRTQASPSQLANLRASAGRKYPHSWKNTGSSPSQQQTNRRYLIRSAQSSVMKVIYPIGTLSLPLFRMPCRPARGSLKPWGNICLTE